MDSVLTEELAILKQTARDFAASEIEPHAAEFDRKGEFPTDTIRKAAELGFLGMLIPEKYGGVEMGNLALSILIEELSRACASIGVILSVHNSLLGNTISIHGKDEQK